eukprot:gene18302-20125_t
MPANSKKSKQPSKRQEFEFIETNSAGGVQDEEAPPILKSRKRNLQKMILQEDTDSEEQNLDLNAKEEDVCANEMKNVLDSFGADISRTLTAKRKRLQSFTQASLKSSNRRYDEILKSQQHERKNLSEEFSKQNSAVFSQWENDLTKAKENEEKLEGLIRQQQKSLQQQRVIQTQRIKALKQLHDQYLKSLHDLEKVHHHQQNNIQGELKKELALLQKKMLMDTQQEEISNVRKSLQTMLGQV